MKLVAEDKPGFIQEIKFEELVVLFVVEIVEEISHRGEFGEMNFQPICLFFWPFYGFAVLEEAVK